MIFWTSSLCYSVWRSSPHSPHIRRPKLEWALRACPPIHNTYECIGPDLLHLEPCCLPVPPHIRLLSSPESRSSQLISLELNKLTLKRFQYSLRPRSMTHHNVASTCYKLRATLLFLRTSFSHGILWNIPHVLYHRGPIFQFFGPVTKLAQTHTTLTCKLIPQSCVGPALHQWSKKEKGVRASGLRTARFPLLQYTGDQVV